MEVRRLGDIATYVNGYAFKPGDRGTEGLPIIRIQDLTGNAYDLGFYKGEYPSRVEINNGDVLISWSASLGVYVWDRGKALLNQHIFKVVFDKIPVDKLYFVYAVRYNLKEMESKTHGATMKHIVKKDFDNTLVPFPSIKKQAEIAGLLQKVTTVIEARQKELQILDELIRARFVEMFGDPHKNTEYPYIKIGNLTTVVSGGTPDRKNEEFWNGGTIPWVKTSELQNNLITQVEENITEKGLAQSSARIVPENTILIAMYGQGKTRGMTAFLGIKASTNQACACLLPTDKIDMRYFWYFLLLSYDKLRGLAQGGNQPNLNAGMIKEFPILVPTLSRQKEFTSFVSQVDKSKEHLNFRCTKQYLTPIDYLHLTEMKDE